MEDGQGREILALVVRQWLDAWDEVQFSDDPQLRRRKPPREFYLFTLPAQKLRRLSRVYRREADRPRAEDPGIQRSLQSERVQEIGRFVQGGFPWSVLSARKKQSSDFRNLKMPGWLPTAIVANILPSGASRGGAVVADSDVIRVEKMGAGMARLILPVGFDSAEWTPEVRPIEIIDGQHRLWAFGGDEGLDGNFELPVVAFHGLDVTWQAYLFYTINIKPKRINASLAFDLYPLLRVQEWLERSPEGLLIYRETRAQELTEMLWAHPESPWRDRINMLGERKAGPVTQAAFIRSLIASYVKRWEGPGVKIGGLFGAELQAGAADVLEWSRVQQAAFLIFMWQCVAEAVGNCRAEWAERLRKTPVQGGLFADAEQGSDRAFTSRYSLLATDQGVRGVLQVTNDMFYVAANKLQLSRWRWVGGYNEDFISEKAVTDALDSLRKLPALPGFLEKTAAALTQFDWRTSSTPELEDTKRTAQMVFRGSGGYKELRRQLLVLLRSAEDVDVRSAAEDVWSRLGY